MMLLRMGFNLPRLSPAVRWALTPPFHPYPANRMPGGFFSVPLSVALGAWMGRRPNKVAYGAWPLASILPAGVRTFLREKPGDRPTRSHMQCITTCAYRVPPTTYPSVLDSQVNKRDACAALLMRILQMKHLVKRVLSDQTIRINLAAITAIGTSLLACLPAHAVEYPVHFGEPVVLSEQGQPLKVLLPFEGAPNDRATAVAFLVKNADVPDGFRAPITKNFVVMRPDASPYVIFHSSEDVQAPQIVLTVDVQGDPDSPYQMRLNIPENGKARTTLATGGANNDLSRGRYSTVDQNSFRKVPHPAAQANLPPK